MERENIPFRIVDIEHDAEAARFVEHQNSGNRTVPTVVFPNGTVMTNPPIRAVRAVMTSG
jgi:mycoredoxin